jgi:two-component system OmpR family sensor kinase
MTSSEPEPADQLVPSNVSERRALARRRLTSRQRLTIQLLIGLTVLFALFGAITVTAARRALNERLDKELTAVAINSANTLERLPTADYAGMASRTAVVDQTYTVVLVAPDGTQIRLSVSAGVDAAQVADVLSTTNLRRQSGQPFTVDDPAGTGKHFRVVSIAMNNGYVILVARSPDEDQGAVTTIAQVLLVGFITLFAALCLLEWVVSRQALKPLEEVIATTDTIDYDNLTSRVNATSNARDVEHLTDALNGMLTRIEASVSDRQDADRRLRQFVADASHELRTPLAAVLGYTELYEAGIATSPDQVDKAMRRIAIEGARMQRLVDDLLTLARLDEGRPQQPSAVDLRAIASEAVAAAQATDQQHTFRLHTPGSSPVALVDPDAIRQILDNLLTNVRNHTPAGTTATIELTSNNGAAHIVISDNGSGMTPTEREHAFDRFWRADAARSRPGGSGLGLAIVHGLVHANNGSVRLDESDSGGVLTEIELPLGPRTQSPNTSSTTQK